jgi:hypothetical protein
MHTVQKSLNFISLGAKPNSIKPALPASFARPPAAMIAPGFRANPILPQPTVAESMKIYYSIFGDLF